MNLTGLPELLHSNIGLRVKLHFDGEEEPVVAHWVGDARTVVCTEVIVEKPNTNNNDVPQVTQRTPVLTTFYGFGQEVFHNTDSETLVRLTGIEEMLRGLSSVIPVVDMYAWKENGGTYQEEVTRRIERARNSMRRVLNRVKQNYAEGRPWHTSQEIMDGQFDRDLHEKVLKISGYEINDAGRYLAKAQANIYPPVPNQYTTYIKYRHPVYWSTRTGEQLLDDHEMGKPDTTTYTYNRSFAISGLSTREFTPNEGTSWITVRISVFQTGPLMTYRRMLPFVKSWTAFDHGHNMLRDYHDRYPIRNHAFYSADDEDDGKPKPRSYTLYIDPYEHFPEKCDICTPQTSASDDYIVDKEQLKTIFYRQLGVNA